MKFRYLLSHLLFVFVLNVNFISVSANENKVEKERRVSSQKNAKPMPKVSSGKHVKIKTLEEFIPSEEISADKPISFPADI